MEPTFTLTRADADVVYHALTYYASDLLDAFVEDDEAPLFDEAAQARDLALNLQHWFVANRQALIQDIAV